MSSRCASLIIDSCVENYFINLLELRVANIRETPLLAVPDGSYASTKVIEEFSPGKDAFADLLELNVVLFVSLGGLGAKCT